METEALQQFFCREWAEAINRHRNLLDDDDRETVESFRSWHDVQRHVFDGVPPAIALIRPALGHLSIFAEFFETKLGQDLDASFVWGTLACLLKLAADDPETLGKIPRMVKSLAHKAEAFNRFGHDVQVVSNPIKEACFDMQMLLVEFFTVSISYIHQAGDVPLHHGGSPYRRESGSPLQLIEQRHATTNQELGEAVSRVEKLIQMNSSKSAQKQSTDAIVKAPKLRCLMLPPIKTTRFFDRVDVFEKLDQILGKGSLFRSVALYGLGGIGKSSIASTYIERKFNENDYEIALWVRGEKPESLRQSFTDIAMRLKLHGAQPQTHDENLLLVQDWFQSTGKSKFCKKFKASYRKLTFKADCRWLIVYDNVESADMLMPYWPGSSQGEAIITTRNHSLAFEPASSGVEVITWDPKKGSEFPLFLLKREIGRDLEVEGNSALALSERLSGHALAISQMAGIIYDGEFSIQEFMTMYLRNPRRAHATNEMAALWDFSFKSLDQNSRSLLGVLSYLMPDIIPQELFEAGAGREFPEDLDFCSDDFR
ncbi:pfs domain-containing protein, partial [Metarhizium majus ARSEF 297]